ncbi:hypothetical protein S144_58 [Shewanella sp. phage 1/44]|uniref:hypothetical protein n=1 Tax=Shewanella sp. phage 1/44 TaxID=1458862 RepID=UPI0004F698D8|nr:hypothetical protein S144_58 [Shewanella sp. phage 1/44]AHK11772.1 hypothetical protein S144_58 [Shewanella sp. phage 1/44]
MKQQKLTNLEVGSVFYKVFEVSKRGDWVIQVVPFVVRSIKKRPGSMAPIGYIFNGGRRYDVNCNYVYASAKLVGVTCDDIGEWFSYVPDSWKVNFKQTDDYFKNGFYTTKDSSLRYYLDLNKHNLKLSVLELSESLLSGDELWIDELNKSIKQYRSIISNTKALILKGVANRNTR